MTTLEQDMRREALSMALSHHHRMVSSDTEVIKTAEKFFNFLRGRS